MTNMQYKHRSQIKLSKGSAASSISISISMSNGVREDRSFKRVHTNNKCGSFWVGAEGNRKHRLIYLHLNMLQ